ncbi:unnamed protein product, partial [Ectocarpus sp. 12 AP-2014]
KRGLLGQIYALLGFETSGVMMLTFLTSIAVVAALFLSFVIYTVALPGFYQASATRAHGQQIAIATLCALILTSPGSVQQSFFDIGRFDVIGATLLLMAVLAILRTGRVPSFLMCLAIIGISILVHEAFALWIAPMCLALWIWQNGFTRQNMMAVFGAALLVLILTLFALNSSYQDVFTFEQAKEHLQARAGFGVSENSLKIQFRSVPDNMTYAFERSWNASRRFGLSIAAVFVALFIAI